MPNDESDPQLSASPLSPLAEAQASSIDELMERIDSKLVLGMPKEIEWKDVEDLAQYLFSQRRLFVQLQQENIRPSRSRLTPKVNPKDRLKQLEGELEY